MVIKPFITNIYVLDAAGNPQPCLDTKVWGLWFGAADRKVAEYRTPDDAVTISTVFLGVDHNFGGGKPLLYETMIFGGEHDGFCHRSETRADALLAHVGAIGMLGPEPVQDTAEEYEEIMEAKKVYEGVDRRYRVGTAGERGK